MRPYQGVVLPLIAWPLAARQPEVGGLINPQTAESVLPTKTPCRCFVTGHPSRLGCDNLRHVEGGGNFDVCLKPN